MKQVRAIVFQGRKTASKAFDKLDKPTLLLYGEASPTTDESKLWREQLAKVNEKVRLKVIKKAGYMPGLENPKAFTEAITAFLD